jgi:hypothetical protein
MTYAWQAAAIDRSAAFRFVSFRFVVDEKLWYDHTHDRDRGGIETEVGNVSGVEVAW